MYSAYPPVFRLLLLHVCATSFKKYRTQAQHQTSLDRVFLCAACQQRRSGTFFSKLNHTKLQEIIHLKMCKIGVYFVLLMGTTVSCLSGENDKIYIVIAALV